MCFGLIGWTTTWPELHQLPWSVSVHLAVNQRLECSFSPLSLPYPSLSRDYPRWWVSLSLTKVNGISRQWWSKVRVLRERNAQAWTRTHLSVKVNVVSVQTGLTLAFLWWVLAIEIESQLKSLINNTSKTAFKLFLCFPRQTVLLSTLRLLSENYIHGNLKQRNLHITKSAQVKNLRSCRIQTWQA